MPHVPLITPHVPPLYAAAAYVLALDLVTPVLYECFRLGPSSAKWLIVHARSSSHLHSEKIPINFPGGRVDVLLSLLPAVVVFCFSCCYDVFDV